MTAETCGMSAMPANVAPPLKSTSTRLSCSEEWVIARPSTRVRRNSDLPEPVAPITRPCGPMPCWADSLMSRWIRPPPSPMPIGTRSRSRAGRGRQAVAGSKAWTSPRPSRSMKSGVDAVISPRRRRRRLRAGGRCSGASRRANASAVARSHWSASALIGSSRSRSARHRALAALVGRRRRTGAAAGSESSSSSQRLGRSSRVTPCRPSGGTTWLPGGRSPPSITSRMCGVAAPLVGAEAGPVAEVGRAAASPRSSSEVDTIRIGPTASDSLGALGVREPLHPVPVGEVLLGAEHRDDEVLGGVEGGRRADHRPGQRAGRSSASPQTSIRSKARRSIDAGRSGWSRCTTSSRCSAEAAAGSTWSIGRALRRHQLERQRLASTGRSARAGSCRRSPCAPRAGSAPRRATGSAAGSGWCQVSARRCWSAASRATLRTLAR